MSIKNPTEIKIIFVDHAPVKQKNDIYQGGQVRRYYAWKTLNQMAEPVIPFRKENGDINWQVISLMFRGGSRIWIEYGCGGTAHIFTLFASLVRSNKIIINVHDFAVDQRRDFDKNPSLLKRFRLNIMERLLIQRAHALILAWPGMLDYFTPRNDQKLLVMVPGVEEYETCGYVSNKNKNGRKIALYFGGMKRKGMIPWISALFSELKGWELHLIGLREGEEIVEMENVKYTGSVSHEKILDIICNADTILIPNPNNDYMNRLIPMKAGYALRSCKPVIASRLRGFSEYVTMVGLQENVIYLDDWNPDSLKEALKKAENIKIDVYKTIEKLRPLSWEPRFKKAIEVIFDESRNSVDQIEWV